MKIRQKLLMDRPQLLAQGPINIAVFGDSVSHGALLDDYDYENVYWNLLRRKLNKFRDYVPVNIINASVSGTTAAESLKRMEKHVFRHEPDLVIICFGLNDTNLPLESYLFSLRSMFQSCIDKNTDAIFLTPNMLNTYVAEDVAEKYREYARKTADCQNSGKMDQYIYSAKALAEEMGIPVCDCYSKWKELAKTEDTTMLLINRINHPVPQMHKLFAEALYELIMGDAKAETDTVSSIYKGE